MNWFAKMIFNEGGSSKNLIKSRCRLCKISNTVKQFGKQLKILPTFNRGSILIEFAVCMPVLIILLYYINDLSKLKRYYDQTEFVAQQMVNMIQNISQDRENKVVTKRDLGRIENLAWLSVFPGNTMFCKGSNTIYELGYAWNTIIYYVQANDDGTASCRWRAFNKGEYSYYVPNIYYTDNKGSPVRYKTNVAPNEIYPTLKMDGRDKMIIVTTLYRTSNYTTPARTSLSNKQSFGFYMLNPSHLNETSSTWYFFYSVVIFTPQKGLFDPDNPPS